MLEDRSNSRVGLGLSDIGRESIISYHIMLCNTSIVQQQSVSDDDSGTIECRGTKYRVL